MTVRINKPAFNIREKLTELKGDNLKVIPAWNLRPNSSANESASGDNIMGWTDNTTNSRETVCFLAGGVTLGPASGNTRNGGDSTGRIIVPVSGLYKVWCTIRCENTPGAGNIYLNAAGVGAVARQHVEVWARYNYAHGFMSQILHLGAGEHIEWRVNISTSSTISGYNDTVNWAGGHLIT